MNLLKQILAFNQRQMSNPLSAGQFILWHALLNVHNDCGKQEWFTVANLRLELFTGLSRQGIDKARNTLKQLGLLNTNPTEQKQLLTKLIFYITIVYNLVYKLVYKIAVKQLAKKLRNSCQKSCQTVGKIVEH